MKQIYQRPTRTPAQLTEQALADEAAWVMAQSESTPAVAEASRPSRALLSAIDADAVVAAHEDPYFD